MTSLEVQLRRVETRASMLEHEISKLEDQLLEHDARLGQADMLRLADWVQAVDARTIALLRAHGWAPA